MKRINPFFIFLSLVFLSCACSPKKILPPNPRSEAWATPINANGLPNLFIVSGELYRGAQPTTEGFKALEKMGIKTVINLRATHSDEYLMVGIKLKYFHISFKSWHPEDEDMVQFLKIVTDPTNQPVFVHCQYGSDRTGTMVALYRIVVQGWTKDEAIDEMLNGGFGFHPIWQNLIDFIKDLDIDHIRKLLNMN